MIILILVVDDQLNLQYLAHAQIIPLFKENKNPQNTLHSYFSASHDSTTFSFLSNIRINTSIMENKSYSDSLLTSGDIVYVVEQDVSDTFHSDNLPQQPLLKLEN